MMKINDGGPAFPRDGKIVRPDGKEYTELQYAQSGQSLRDYFAGQALAGMLSIPHVYDGVTEEGIACRCYHHADAMIAERAKAK